MAEPTDATGIIEGHTPAELPLSDTEQGERVSKFMQAFRDAADVRMPFDNQWEMNAQILKGNQLVLRNSTTGAVRYAVRDDKKRMVAINNVIKPTARALLGKLTKNVSSWGAAPASDDLSDMQAAEVTEALLQFHFRRLKMQSKLIKWRRDEIVKGVGIFKLYWDSATGPVSPMCPDCGYIPSKDEQAQGATSGQQCPHCVGEAQTEYDNQAQQVQAMSQAATGLESMGGMAPEMEPLDLSKVSTLQDTPEGDIQVDIIDPYEFYFDPGASSLENCQWVCHRVSVPVPKLRRMFPEHGEFISADSLHYTDRAGVLSATGFGNYSRQRMIKDHANLYEFHEVPTDEHPQGRIVWIANNRILKEEDSNYYALLNRFPFYLAYWDTLAEEAYGESFIEQAHPLQRELNVSRTQTREMREIGVKPRLLNPYGSGIAVDEITSAAGHVFTYNPNAGKPQFLDPPNMPPWMLEEQNYLTRAIQAQATVSEHEAGSAPSDNSGRFAAILDAQSNAQVGPTLKIDAVEFVALGEGIISLCHENYRDERTWTIQGDDRPHSYVFKQARIGQKADVIIYEDDALSHNPVLRREETLKMSVERPELFLDPKTGQFDVKTFAKMAGIRMPSINTTLNGSDKVSAAALPSILEERLATGEAPWNAQTDTRTWDDADVWAQELLAWLKSAGRVKEQALVDQVQAAWQFYTEQSASLLQAQQGQPGQGQPGQGAPGQEKPSPPGGENPFDQGGQSPASSKSTSPVQEVQRGIASADHAAESAARASKHEG